MNAQGRLPSVTGRSHRLARSDRGAVTVEAAFASLGVAMLVALVVSLGAALLVQIRCTDSASAIARQAARGDTAAVEQLTAAVPAGAVVSTQDDATSVTVVVTAPFPLVSDRAGVPEITGRAMAVKEPGRVR